MTKSEKSEEFFKRYQTYPEIQEYLKVLHSKYPTKTQLDVIGKTFENRDIVALRVFSGNMKMEKRKGVFINSAQHAREWISPATTLYMVTEILKRTANNDPVIKPLMEKLVIHYVPVVNPDGYIHSFVNRMWRKNRFRNSGGSYGVDLNRNFVWAFGGPGSSGVQSSETYRGTAALSEKESMAIDKYLDKYNGTIKVGIDYHSFSQYLLRPWDYSRNPTDDEVALEKITTEWRKEIRSVHNFDYASMRGAQMYLHSGGIMDHFYGVKKFFGFCVELRPRSGGFVIDPKNIIPSGEENFKGLIVLLKYAAGKN
jgi:murein tripeptide amidase MpaA